LMGAHAQRSRLAANTGAYTNFGQRTVLMAVLAAMLTLGLCIGGVVANQAQGAEGACANEQARAEQPYALELPDCRAYEMVSPLNKNDNNIIGGNVRSAVSGEAVTYISRGSFAEPKSALIENRYLSRRGQSGWSTIDISPRYEAFTGNISVPFGELFFTPDLSKGVVSSEYVPLTDTPPGYVNLYVADTENGSYQDVTTTTPSQFLPYRQEFDTAPSTAGVSTDLSHVVFQEAAGLTPNASPKQRHIYEFVNGEERLVDVAPEGKTLDAEEGELPGGKEANDYVGAPGGFDNPGAGDVWHAVSSDGSRVFFTGGEFYTGLFGDLGQLYLRETNQEKTIDVSASQRTPLDPNDPSTENQQNGIRPARYWDASSDGSKVFFTSRAELTDNANTGPADNVSNLYEYNVETGVLTDLTVDTNPADADGAAVLGLVNASEDGSHVYFVAEGQLAEGASGGQPNMYLYYAGKVTYIATLAPAANPNTHEEEKGGDSKDWFGQQPEGTKDGSSDPGGPGVHTARVTPDGEYLAFESVRSLTGYDNEPVEPEQCENNACREVYLYDATTDKLSCASCDPDGARPVGAAELGGTNQVEEELDGPSPFYLPQNLSEDGSRLFFETPDALVPHDSNGQSDVYEYENGQVYPISDVAGNKQSHFLDASSSGDNVFISTSDQLLVADTDTRIDIYDARVGGGFPVSVVPPTCDNGDSCKVPVSAQPSVFGPPPSATFSGAGNVAPIVAARAKVKVKSGQCKRGFVKKHGKCVRQKKKPKTGSHSNKGRK
jgi:hypothetical protein